MCCHPPALESLEAVRNSDVAAPEDGRAPAQHRHARLGKVFEGLQGDGLVRACRSANYLKKLFFAAVLT
jgi:hypothetical protein